MKAMNFPVLPPTFPKAFPRFLAAPVITGPADEVTRERPSLAFDWKSDAFSDAFEVVSFAASVALEEVDSNLRAARPGSLVDCRSTEREICSDIMEYMRGLNERKDSRITRGVDYRGVRGGGVAIAREMLVDFFCRRREA